MNINLDGFITMKSKWEQLEIDQNLQFNNFRTDRYLEIDSNFWILFECLNLIWDPKLPILIVQSYNDTV